MGLDTYASRTPDDVELSEEDERAFKEAGLELCGGFHSDGESSFRGKIYEEFIREITNVSLYQEWISPEVVRGMAVPLAACDPETAVEEHGGSQWPSIAPRTVRDLQKFFAICAERGLGLIGWW